MNQAAVLTRAPAEALLLILPGEAGGHDHLSCTTVVAGLPVVRRIALAGTRAGFGRIVVHGLHVDGALAGIRADQLDPAEAGEPGSQCRLVLLPANVVPQPDWLRALLAAPVILAVNLYGIGLGFYVGNNVLRAFDAGIYLIKPQSNVYVIATNRMPTGQSLVNYVVHAGAYYTFDTKAVNLGNYEPNFPYFPVTWRVEGPPQPRSEGIAAGWRKIDYLIFWRIDTVAKGYTSTLRDHFILRLWTPDLEIWERRPERPGTI